MNTTWLSAVLAGIGCAAFAAWLWRIVADPPPARLPVEAPPLGFRLAWRLVGVAGRYCQGGLSWTRRRRLEAALARAGLRHALEAIHMVGAQLLCGLAGLLLALLVLCAVDTAVPWPVALTGALGLALAGYAYPMLWLRERMRMRAAKIRRALPFALDMTTLCVEAGLNLSMALQQAAGRMPEGPLSEELKRTLGDIRAGAARAQALGDLAARLDIPEVHAWTGALIQSDALGMSLAPILRAQSDQRRTERFLSAEQLAMEAPVKMLLPLIACIFPCSFLVIGFPIAVKLLDLGF